MRVSSLDHLISINLVLLVGERMHASWQNMGRKHSAYARHMIAADAGTSGRIAQWCQHFLAMRRWNDHSANWEEANQWSGRFQSVGSTNDPSEPGIFHYPRQICKAERLFIESCAIFLGDRTNSAAKCVPHVFVYVTRSKTIAANGMWRLACVSNWII